MAHIDELVQKVTDPVLREALAAQVRTLTDRKEFGLVFQHHLPETVRLPKQRIRRGDTVERRAVTRGSRYRVVRARAAEPTVSVIEMDGAGDPAGEGEVLEVLRSDLVVVKLFGEPVYPGFQQRGIVGVAETARPSHVIINGENFHALQALEYTHSKKVDVIYIDPPYNTGSSDWLYNDRYVDSSDRYRHSKWLSFVERRLKIAKALLKESGVIFVSIDDNEQHRLRMLLDHVFGEANFVDTLAVEMSTTSGPKTTNAQQGTIVKNVEFVHIYRKSAAFDDVKHTPLYDSVKQWDSDYALWLNEDGTITDFVAEIDADPGVRADIEKFGFVTAKGKFLGMRAMDGLLAVSEVANKFVLDNLHRIARRDIPPVSCKDVDAPIRGWIEVEADHRTYILTRLRSGTLNQVYTLARNYRRSDDYRPGFGRTVIRGDLWKGFHQDMGNVSREGGVAFNNGKKPVRLIKQLIRWANNNPDAVILDFFGGSGTTAHAVIDMNSEDGGHRQCILITNNEVSRKDDSQLRRRGLEPGDEEYEAQGVFHAVTKPRLEKVLEAVEDQSAAFLEVTYEDENLVALGRKFEAVAPLIWLKAGGTGEIIDKIEPAGFSAPTDATYAIIFDTDAAGLAIGALHAGIHRVFIVTDSEADFRTIVAALPSRLQDTAERLYSSYLRSFEINRA